MQNPTYTYAGPGNFIVTLITETGAGCTDTATAQVAVAPDIITDFSFTSGCLEFATTFTDLSNSPGGSITAWAWDFGDGVGASTLANPNYTYTAAGTYTVSLIANPGNTCADTTTKTIVVEPKPTADFVATPTVGCEPLTVRFSDQSNPNGGILNDWKWVFGDGKVDNSQNPTNIYEAPGTYTVTLYITSLNNCKDTITLANYITVNPRVVANFVAAPNVVDEYTPWVTLTDLSTGGANSWLWDLGNGTTSTNQNDVVQYADSGSYPIMLIANNAFNCPDTAYSSIRVRPVTSFYIPNAFTPDGDGLNDYFAGEGRNLKEYEMMIFNRWGQMIYRTTDPKRPWDGGYKSSDTVLVDSYIYQFNVVDMLGAKKTYRGTVTVIR